MKWLLVASVLLAWGLAHGSVAHAEGDPAKGKKIYIANCSACHNLDPAKPGALGPDIKGSSKELLTLRIISATYPAGYAPKRPTKLMVALPHLKPHIDDLAAYLK